ncbi:c-type cytochrome [Oceaniglobus trochenteri]|uniref:c-type cytochrome n=1 Tax=Oceaniglobus trochenteri TaxID=2763260 RepID=UPI001CFFDB34|nr:c-type cytochrome [Oceaniglobus trochenteri]
MKRVLQTLAALAVLAGLAGGAVVGLGLYNVSARVGHLQGVSWVLHTTFRNSVRLRAARPAEMPDLSDPALIELGARHYDTACRSCHAAPGEAQSATMAAMVPAPPPIGQAVQGWKPYQLHWIVANGIKMSGMPPWPAQREDDVWPVVAFLSSVQQGMEGADYGTLTRLPDEEAPLAYCLGCHGDGGLAQVPPLNGQGAAYLEMALQAYRGGTRASGIMAQAAREVPPETMGDLARWFAAQPVAPIPPQDMPADLVERGRALVHADTGDPDVPACRACHGPDRSERSAFFPNLAGLPAPYLRTQLGLWRDGRRGGGPQAGLMRKAARHLDDSDIAALVAYYASLPAETGQ